MQRGLTAAEIEALEIVPASGWQKLPTSDCFTTMTTFCCGGDTLLC